MRYPNQIFIFNDQELELIKNTFAENDILLYTVRKVFLQFPLTDPEKNLIKLGMTPEVIQVLKKRMLPELSDDFPIGQLPSLLTTLTEQLKVKTPEEMAPLFAAKKLEMDYLAQQFTVLGNLDAPQPIKLKDMAVIDETQNEPQFSANTRNYINLQTYLFLLGYIDPMLNFIRSIAGEKKETVEETKKRMTRDSGK